MKHRLPFTDKVISKIAIENDLPTLTKTSALFKDLIENVISQQLSGRVAEAIFKRFCNLFPDNIPTPQLVLEHEVEKYRMVGLSNAKANYVKNIADYAISNNLSIEFFDSLSDDEVVKELIKIKGVGVWTAQMVLIFSLNRPDVFPVSDLAIRVGMQKLYGVNFEGKFLVNKLIEIAEYWKPNRTLGTRYVWAWVNRQK